MAFEENLENLKKDPKAKEILEFYVLEMKQPDFVFYGSIMRDIYQAKIQDYNSGTVKVMMEREIQKEKFEWKQKTAELETENKGLKVKIASEEKEHSETKRKLLHEQNMGEEKLQAKVNETNKLKENKIEEMRKTFAKQKNEDLENERKVFQKRLEEKEDEIKRMDRINIDLTKKNEKLMNYGETLDEIKENVSKSRNSAEIGKQGEDWTLQCLEEAFPTDHVAVKTGKNNCGDIYLQLPDMSKIMIEVKDYQSKQTIRSQKKGNEINKFKQDSKSCEFGGFKGTDITPRNTHY